MMKAFSVTQEHIDSATPSHPLHCPIAKGMNEAFPDYDRIEVKKGMIFFYVDESTTMGMRIPKSIRKFVRKFDHKEPVEPGTFSVDFSTAERL